MTDGEPPLDAPEVTASERVHERYVGLRIDSLRYASGRTKRQDIVEHPGGITLVPIDDDGQVLLVRQYRHAAGRPLLELPAGTLDGDEPHEAAAQRELQEEVGYRAGTLERLGGFYTAPGYSDEYLPVYLATDLVESRLDGDEEAIHVVPLELDDVLLRIAEGEIEDAKTVAALLLYLQHRGLV